ncbi:MAG: hypothetical protein JXR40_05985 [Pontiellaceae bacterium]|nr:hypothetical protein [Pontiellaceae bacterium]
MRFKPHSFIALLLSLLLPMNSLAETRVKVKDIEVKARLTFDHNVDHGYTEYRFTVINHDAAKAHTVQVALDGNDTITKTITVPPGSRIEFPLFRQRSMSSHMLNVTVDNRHKKETWFDESFIGSDDKISLLLSKTINQDDLQAQVERQTGTRGSSVFHNEYTLHRTDLSPNEWSDNWLAYSSFDGMVMQASDIAAMPPKVISALKQYVECGGILSLIGNDQCPFSGNTVVRLPYNESWQNVYAVGLGYCLSYRDDNSDNFLKREIRLWNNNKAAFPLNESEIAVNERFPVVEKMNLPVRGFLLLVTLFALIAGPLTIFVLAKTNRRIWLLWVIPLESAVACGIILLYALFSEGITPTVRMKNITLLDQQQHTAVSLGWIGYYCPQKPSDGLLFADDWEINRVQIDHYRSGSMAMETATSVDWTRGQHLQMGWISSRFPTFLMCRRNSIRRERLEISGTEVVNGLGADIEKLWYCAPDGTLYEAKNLQAGQKGSMRNQGTVETAPNSGLVRNLFTASFPNYIDDSLKNTPKNYLRPGTYIAVLKGTPFMEHGLGDRKVKLTAESVVYGILAKEEQP